MDIALVIRHRLQELGLEQKDLARAARVTESYISQLLTRRKAPPDPGRSDIYGKMEELLELPAGELADLARTQRREELRRRLEEPPRPLFAEVRALILRKCRRGKRRRVRSIFERQPFGELERLITQNLLDAVKGVAKEELESEEWLHRVAGLSGRSYEEMRVLVLEFLDTDIFDVSIENCVSFLDPLIESWDIDLESFAIEVVLNRRLTARNVKRFEFVEHPADGGPGEEEGLREFLADPSFSGDATEEELEFLRRLEFGERRPTPLYYYRALQNLRDPLHFRTP